MARKKKTVAVNQEIVRRDAGEKSPATYTLLFKWTDTNGDEKSISIENATYYEDVVAPIPTRTTGYWVYSGWHKEGTSDPLPTTGEITSDATYTTDISAAQINIPLNWNGANNASSEILGCTWDAIYPTITPLPKKTPSPMGPEELFWGAGLVRNGSDTAITITHLANGIGTQKVNYQGFGTGIKLNSDSNQFNIEGYQIKIFWEMPEIEDDTESSEESPESSDSDIETCVVNFVYTEPNGTVKNKGIIEVPFGTPYSEVRSKISEIGVPELESGYWIFNRWIGSEVFDADKVITSDFTCTADFSPAKISIPINPNGATNYDGSEPLECTWGTVYKTLSPLPEKDDKPFAGAVLTNATGKIFGKTHDANGIGIRAVSEGVLGGGTSSDPSHVFGVPEGIEIAFVWHPPVEWNTQQNLRDAVGAIPCPFASDEFATVKIPKDSTDTSEVTFKRGFPEAYTKPLIDPETGKVNQDARVITRRQVNTLGYIGTQEQFFEQCGGYHTFDASVCEAIGGYPRTAILRFFDESINCLRTVYSLVNNNTWNFIINGVDGVHWKYIDDNPILSVKVHYDEFIDLKDVLFVETGMPDFYEIPYDGMLQLYALSFCHMDSTKRDMENEYVVAPVSVSNGVIIDAKMQSAIDTALYGTTYLDIYSIKTNTTESIRIKKDGCLEIFAFIQNTQMPNSGVGYAYKIPNFALSQGSFFLNKGDKIRVRGNYRDIPQRVKISGSIGNADHVFDRIFTDAEIQRTYSYRFANFYRISWEK